MPTKTQVIEKVGQAMWDKMCKTGYLDGITVTMKRALCIIKCTECGFIKTECLDPYTSSYPESYCPHENKNMKFEVVSFLKMEGDIPERDIDVAYRAAHGQKIHEWEWD